MDKSQSESNMLLVTNFIRKWGLDNSAKPKDIIQLIDKHRLGQEDMDKQGELTTLMNDARADYQEIAADEIVKLSWVRYRIEFRKAFYRMADEVRRENEDAKANKVNHQKSDSSNIQTLGNSSWGNIKFMRRSKI